LEDYGATFGPLHRRFTRSRTFSASKEKIICGNSPKMWFNFYIS